MVGWDGMIVERFNIFIISVSKSLASLCREQDKIPTTVVTMKLVLQTLFLLLILFLTSFAADFEGKNAYAFHSSIHQCHPLTLSLHWFI